MYRDYIVVISYAFFNSIGFKNVTLYDQERQGHNLDKHSS